MAKERKEDRQARKATDRAAGTRRKARNKLLKGGVWAAIVAGVAAFAYFSYTERQLLAQVTTATYPAGMHAVGAITYKENPPIGGQHNAMWQNCGIYDVPIHNEHAVHSMEHGAVWITYRPGLAADQIQKLKTAASDDFMLLSPYPGLPSPIVVSAWNHQLMFENASDPRLPKFIQEFKNNPRTTPEFGAPCAGGTSQPATASTLGGAPAQFGR